MPVVMKFGGSSLASIEKIKMAAAHICEERQKHDVVVVVSAQGDTTDELIEKAAEAGGLPDTCQMDMLLSAGEQISASLMCMVLESMGFPAEPMCGWQAGIITQSLHGAARISKVKPKAVLKSLSQGKIVVVAGFQGISEDGKITTIGRGGSDTSAVALAARLGAKVCKIYTDVNGVYSADPRIVPNAVRHDVISVDEMLELASMGAQVLHNRAVELAIKTGTTINVLKTGEGGNGTLIKQEVEGGRSVTAVTSDKEIAYITAKSPERPAVSSVLLKLAGKMIISDMISRRDNSISFAVSGKDGETAMSAMEECGFEYVDITRDVSKISLVGAGIANNPEISARLTDALEKKDIDVIAMSLSEIRASVLVDEAERENALRCVHDCFFA